LPGPRSLITRWPDSDARVCAIKTAVLPRHDQPRQWRVAQVRMLIIPLPSCEDGHHLRVMAVLHPHSQDRLVLVRNCERYSPIPGGKAASRTAGVGCDLGNCGALGGVSVRGLEPSASQIRRLRQVVQGCPQVAVVSDDIPGLSPRDNGCLPAWQYWQQSRCFQPISDLPFEGGRGHGSD